MQQCMTGKRRWPRSFISATLALLVVSPVWGSDEDGNYAIRGVGATSCEQFLERVQQDAATARLYASWQAGYLTAANRHLDETFDISPMMASTAVLNMLGNVCRDNPDIRVETALARLTGLFYPARVEASSPPVTITSGDETVNVRQSVVQRMQVALQDRGYADVETSGRFDESTRDALRDFQANEQIRVTGAPDADTLVRLIFTNEE